MLDKPGKDNYNQPGFYCPIALINTIAKIFEKTIATYMLQIAESENILHPRNYGACPGR